MRCTVTLLTHNLLLNSNSNLSPSCRRDFDFVLVVVVGQNSAVVPTVDFPWDCVVCPKRLVVVGIEAGETDKNCLSLYMGLKWVHQRDYLDWQEVPL